MNKHQLEVTSRALSDMAVIAEYISKDNRRAAQKMMKFLHKTYISLCVHPYMGRTREDFQYQEARFLVVKKNYLVVYRILNSDTVRILRVLPAYQDICALL